MVAISFSQFRQNAKKYLDAVERGETIRVMRHGRVIAEVVPPHRRQPAWKNNGLQLVIPGASLSEAVLKERKER